MVLLLWLPHYNPILYCTYAFWKGAKEVDDFKMQEKSKTKICRIWLFLYLGGTRDQSWIVIHGHSNGWSLDSDHWLLVWLQHLFCAPQFCPSFASTTLPLLGHGKDLGAQGLQASARVVRLWYSTFARTKTLGVRGVGSPKHPWSVESL